MEFCMQKFTEFRGILQILKGAVAWDWDRLEFMLLEKSVLGKEPLVVFKIVKFSFDFQHMLPEMQPFGQKGWKLPRFIR